MNKKEKQQYIDIIKPMLTQKRFEHSLNVSEEAVKLAKKYGADTEKAELAGLLHDITKETDNAVQGYTPGETVENSRGLWYNYERR